MEIASQADGSSRLATVEQIHHRLVRPSSLHSHSSTSSGTRPREDAASCYSSRYDVNSSELLKRKREDQGRNAANKRLEDYLDATLLAAVRTEIGGDKSRGGGGGGGERKSKAFEFEWPVEELKAWTEDWRRERGVVEAVVDLGDDSNVMIGGGEDDEDEERCRSPFRRFETTALKRFGG